jgi:hypothetical protein
MMIASLPEELVLLAYADDGSTELDRSTLDYGLGGALLLELTLAGRIESVDGKVVVRDPSPTGDPLVDDALQQIVAVSRDRGPGHWVSRLSRGVRQRVLDRLVADGILLRQEDKVLWVFPRTRFPAAGGVEAPVEIESRQRLWAAVAGSGPVEPRTAALCALAAATGLDRRIFDRLPRSQAKVRLAEIGEGIWAAAAVRKVIEEVQAAVVVTAVT